MNAPLPDLGEIQELSAAIAAMIDAGAEVPSAASCVKVAKLHQRHGDRAGAWRWAVAAVAGRDDFVAWTGAVRVMDQCRDAAPPARRTVRMALLGSATTSQYAD